MSAGLSLILTCPERIAHISFSPWQQKGYKKIHRRVDGAQADSDILVKHKGAAAFPWFFHNLANYMKDTPENRNAYIQRARREKLRPGIWVRAWFALAKRGGESHFIVHGLTKNRRPTHFNNSGVPCSIMRIKGNYRAGEAELREAGFTTENFDGSDPEHEITL